MDEVVSLICIKVGGKLRVRIASPNYMSFANCRFPRNIRKEGCQYTVSKSDVTLCSGSSGTYFYRIGKKSIKIIENIEDVSLAKIFEDEKSDCVICMEADKESVFAPCGHFYCCESCAKQIYNNGSGKCPICRASISQIVSRDKIQ